jgi:hypothetical protein
MKISIPLRSKLRSPASLLVCALSYLACAGAGCAGNALDQRDLGNTSTPINPTPVLSKEGIDPFVEGHWLGQAEDLFAPTGADGVRPIYRFPSGSTEITLDLSASGPGQIVFGAGAVPEPEAGASYPPGFDAYSSFSATRGQSVQLPPLEGFSYVLSGTIDGAPPPGATGAPEEMGIAAGALEMGYAPNGAYADWCALQTPHRTEAGGFDCMTATASTEPAECRIYQAFDCSLGALCQADSVCHCRSSGCNLESVPYHHLWLVRDGDDLLGSFVGAVFDYGNRGRFLPMGPVRFRHE